MDFTYEDINASVGDEEAQKRVILYLVAQHGIEDNFDVERGPYPTTLKPEQVSHIITHFGVHSFLTDRRQAHVFFRLVQFYGLQEVAHLLKDEYDRPPGESSVRGGFLEILSGRATLLEAIAQVGDENDRKWVLGKYETLVENADGEKQLTALRKLYFSLARGSAPKSLLKKTKGFREARKELGRAIEEKEVKDKVLALPLGPKRLLRLAEIYLGVDTSISRHRLDFAGYQFVNDARSLGTDEALKALQKAMKNIEPQKYNPDHLEESLTWIKRRGFRARLYYGENITKNQDAKPLMKEFGPNYRLDNFGQEKYDDIIRPYYPMEGVPLDINVP